ncbi:hypothetical protein ILUMI_24370 [Ignelater luminosus]|uniref:Uncharacterized protein n=1 Tax=Ignelater luminosus TaxID=2038154 RepID=A0A8K0C779_IGNLU|nr:hypothetical protein ILUMI_24370 [Ignelater luminosus]
MESDDEYTRDDETRKRRPIVTFKILQNVLASKNAYGICVYLRSTDQSGTDTTHLLCTKSIGADCDSSFGIV